MAEGTINLNVILLPPGEISQKAVKLSKKIAKEFNTFFVLNDNCIPHISLYHAAYPVKSLPMIKQAITDIVNNLSVFPVELTTVFWQKEGWLDFQATKSESLVNLHDLVVKNLNHFREGRIMDSDKKDFDSYSAEEQENLKFYGYLHSKKLFRPHLTITRLKEDNVSRATEKIKGENLSFTANMIALCNLGNHGTCISILEKWDLKSQNK